MHVEHSTALIVVALVSSIILVLNRGDRLWPVIAVVATGIVALMHFGVITLSLGKFRVDDDRSRPKQAQRTARRRDDGRFQPAFGRSAVDDQRDPAPKALEDMLGPRWADRAAGVGGWRGQRPVDSPKERLHRRMRWNPQPDRRQSGGHDRCDGRSFAKRHDQGQWTRPVPLSERYGVVVEEPDLLGGGEVTHMDNQRVEARSSLRFVDACDRAWPGRVGRKPVNSLRRHGDGLASQHQARGLGNRLVVEGEDPRLH